MDVFQAATLGLVQGVTEFLPISSTAHLVLTPWLLGWEADQGLTFDVALHIGTLFAMLVYFRRDLTEMFFAWISSFRANREPNPYRRLSWLVIFGTVPVVIAGVFLDKYVDGVLRSPWVIGGTFIGVALLIALAERTSKLERTWKDLRLKDAMLIGLAQAVALIPGVSRSGSTIMAGLFLGLERADAARFSFLLGFPVTIASIVFKFKDLGAEPMIASQLPMMAVGTVVSAVSGFLCIHYLLKFLQRFTMNVFVVYRIAFGLMILGMAWMGMGPDFAGG
ncbi:MAG: undecaprenyl-diphosphate phosphatase [Candidatus Sericytochromatia bacterium]